MQNAECRMQKEERAPVNIQERAEAYALRAVKLFRYLRKRSSEEGWIIGRQYLRSATSVGANLVEAQSGETRRDFIHKCCISLKEARESRYWLRLLARSGAIKQERLAGLMDETEQLISILVAIVRKAKKVQ